MAPSRIALLAGVGALALAGVARAAAPDSHVINVRLPGGQVEQIRYTGNTAPTIVLLPDAAPQAMVLASQPMIPPSQAMIGDPFTMLRQISALMDAQAAAMMRVMAMPPIGVGGLAPVTVAAGPGVCMRSVQITYTGAGAPHVVSRTAGDCGAAGQAPRGVAIPEQPLPARPSARTIEARNDTSRIYADNRIHPVSDLSR
jgi:hypothetical protein